MKYFFIVLLCSLAFSQAQLIPPGMVLQPSERAADSSASPAAPVPFADESSSQNGEESQERPSLNWNGPINEDSLRYYQVETFRYSQEATHKHAVSNVLKVVALGLGFAGMGSVGASYIVDDDGKSQLCNFVGWGLLAGSMVSLGFAFGFDASAEGLHLKAEYYNQKLIDYQKRHSVLGPGD
jgi:hypothetical protein